MIYRVVVRVKTQLMQIKDFEQPLVCYGVSTKGGYMSTCVCLYVYVCF